MSDLKEILQHEVLGIPLVGWLILVIGAVLVLAYLIARLDRICFRRANGLLEVDAQMRKENKEIEENDTTPPRQEGQD